MEPFRKDAPPARATTLTISTVDRYQGDENDIVILSLVRCRPGNRFVGLKNRFVVAVSRARLGFFVVGSVQALTEAGKHGSNNAGPAHWKRFIQSLRTTRVSEPQASILKASESNDTSDKDLAERDKEEQDLKSITESLMYKRLLGDFANYSIGKPITGIASFVPNYSESSRSNLTTNKLQENKVESSKITRCGMLLHRDNELSSKLILNIYI